MVVAVGSARLAAPSVKPPVSGAAVTNCGLSTAAVPGENVAARGAAVMVVAVGSARLAAPRLKVAATAAAVIACGLSTATEPSVKVAVSPLADTTCGEGAAVPYGSAP